MAKAPVINEHLHIPSLEEDISSKNSCEGESEMDICAFLEAIYNVFNRYVEKEKTINNEQCYQIVCSTIEFLHAKKLEIEVSKNSLKVVFAKEGMKEPAKHDHSKLSSDKKSQHGKETLKAQAVQEIGEQHADPKESRHQSTIAEENEPVVKDNVQNVVDEPQKDTVGEISVNEHNGPTNKTLSEVIENVPPKTMSPLSRNEQRQLAIQACDIQNEDSTPEAICQQFTAAKEHTDKSVANDISSDKDNELSGVQDSISGEPGHKNDKAIDDTTVPCEDASYQTAYSTEVCKDVSDETISLTHESDFTGVAVLIAEGNDTFYIVNESCESKSTSLETDKVDGTCHTYYAMEECPAVLTNDITESSSEEPEINGVHSSYSVDSNHLNHLKSNQDLQPFAHSLKFIKWTKWFWKNLKLRLNFAYQLFQTTLLVSILVKTSSWIKSKLSQVVAYQVVVAKEGIKETEKDEHSKLNTDHTLKTREKPVQEHNGPSTSHKVFKLYANKAFCCKYAPCARNCMKHLLYLEETGLCPAQVDQKLGQISLGTKFLEHIWEILEEILPLVEIPKEKLLELMSEILEKLPKTPVLPCTQVLIALQEEHFLKSIFKSEFCDDKLIDNAKKKFKESKRKAGILLCVTDKMSHGLILKRDEKGEQVNLYDSTIDEDKMVDFGIIHSLQVLVLEDKTPLIAKKWSKLNMCYCAEDYLKAHKNNIGKKPKESVSH